MAIALTNIGTAALKTAGTHTLSVTVPAGGVPSGACIFTAAASWLTSAAPSVGAASDNVNGTYQNPVSLYFNPGVQSQASIRASYFFNCAALSSGDSISVASVTGDAKAISIFYATGLSTTDPLDATTPDFNGGTTCQMAAAPAVANSLVFAVSGSPYLLADFIQDSTNASYAAPPVAANTTGNPSSGNATVAGGTVISSAQLSYAPVSPHGGSNVGIAAFAPAAPASDTYPWGWGADAPGLAVLRRRQALQAATNPLDELTVAGVPVPNFYFDIIS